MKEVELMLVSELMKNSRRSDRELARALGVSQPTVSRMIKKLEDEGSIREYTVIPDFSKLGLSIMAVTSVKLPRKFGEEEYDEMVKTAMELEKKKGMSIILAARGIGSDYDMVIVSVHKDYSAYHELIADVRQLHSSTMLDTESFLVDLTKDTRYRPLTFSSLAEFLPKQLKVEKKRTKPRRKQT